jgi:hypothetical protein
MVSPLLRRSFGKVLLGGGAHGHLALQGLNAAATNR